MAKFFQSLVNFQLFDNWVGVLDWILDDNRFSETRGWTSGKKRMFTTRSRKLFSEGNLVIGANKDLQWDCPWKRKGNQAGIHTLDMCL